MKNKIFNRGTKLTLLSAALTLIGFGLNAWNNKVQSDLMDVQLEELKRDILKEVEERNNEERRSN